MCHRVPRRVAVIRMLRKQATKEGYRYVFLGTDISHSEYCYECYECGKIMKTEAITRIYGEFFHHSYCVRAARLERGLFQRDIKIVMKSGGKIKT